MLVGTIYLTKHDFLTFENVSELLQQNIVNVHGVVLGVVHK